MQKDKNLFLSPEEAKKKAARSCAFRERCLQEIKEKLAGYGLYEQQIEAILQELEEEDFINEQRYARAFALDKFRQNRWGKNKISYKLREKGIGEEDIQFGIAQIEEDAYVETARQLIREKRKSLTDRNFLIIKQKIGNYMLGKGYEWDLIERYLKENNF